MPSPLPPTRAPGGPDPAADTNLLAAAVLELREGRRDVPIMEVSGNSFAEGGGTGLNRGYRFSRVLADLLGAEEVNRSKDGAIGFQHSDTGGWRAVAKRYKPRAADGTVRASGAPFASCDYAVICRNINDAIVLGAGNLTPFNEMLRSEIARFRACYLWNGDSAGWTNSGMTLNNDTGATDGKWFIASTSGNYVERTTPAEWPGGTMSVQFVGGDSFSATGSVSVDGGQVATMTGQSGLTNATGFYWNITKRFAVPAGAHVIRISSTSAGNFGVNSLTAEAPSPPVIAAMASPLLPTAGSYTTYGITEATLLAQKTSMQSIVAEFDGRVLYYDMESATQKNLAYFSSDELHPNEWGQQLIAHGLADLMRNHALVKRGRTPNGSYRWHLVSDPDGYTGSTFGTNVAAQTFGVFAPPMYRRDADGMVHLRGVLTVSAATINTSTNLFFMPQGFSPETFEVFDVAASDGTTRTRQHVTIAPQSDGTGLVQLPAPNASTAHVSGTNSYVSLSGISYRASL